MAGTVANTPRRNNIGSAEKLKADDGNAGNHTAKADGSKDMMVDTVAQLTTEDPESDVVAEQDDAVLEDMCISANSPFVKGFRDLQEVGTFVNQYELRSGNSLAIRRSEPKNGLRQYVCVEHIGCTFRLRFFRKKGFDVINLVSAVRSHRGKKRPPMANGGTRKHKTRRSAKFGDKVTAVQQSQHVPADQIGLLKTAASSVPPVIADREDRRALNNPKSTNVRRAEGAATSPNNAKRNPDLSGPKNKNVAIATAASPDPERNAVQSKKNHDRSPSNTQVPQLKRRKCGICGIVGHNRARCPQNPANNRKQVELKIPRSTNREQNASQAAPKEIQEEEHADPMHHEPEDQAEAEQEAHETLKEAAVRANVTAVAGPTKPERNSDLSDPKNTNAGRTEGATATPSILPPVIAYREDRRVLNDPKSANVRRAEGASTTPNASRNSDLSDPKNVAITTAAPPDPERNADQSRKKHDRSPSNIQVPQPKRRKCGICGIAGHYRSKCPQNPMNNRKQQEPAIPPSTNGGQTAVHPIQAAPAEVQEEEHTEPMYNESEDQEVEQEAHERINEAAEGATVAAEPTELAAILERIYGDEDMKHEFLIRLTFRRFHGNFARVTASTNKEEVIKIAKSNKQERKVLREAVQSTGDSDEEDADDMGGQQANNASL